MARKEDRLFAADKIAWMLDGGLETMDPGERQLLLIMSETKLQEGYKPTAEEKKVLDRLRTLADEEVDVRELKRNVKKMVKGRSKSDATSINLPPIFDRLIKRLRSEPSDDTD
jgi:hypothetical protein